MFCNMSKNSSTILNPLQELNLRQDSNFRRDLHISLMKINENKSLPIVGPAVEIVQFARMDLYH